MKKVKVLFFGSISEATGRHEDVFELDGTLDDLTVLIRQKYPAVEGIKHSIAINHEINPDKQEIKDGDELALLPPFAGG
jgi:molybdopterin converting factor small subunit